MLKNDFTNLFSRNVNASIFFSEKLEFVYTDECGSINDDGDGGSLFKMKTQPKRFDRVIYHLFESFHLRFLMGSAGVVVVSRENKILFTTYH